MVKRPTVRVPIKVGGPWKNDGAKWERWNSGKHRTTVSGRYFGTGGKVGYRDPNWKCVLTRKDLENIVLHAPKNWDGTLPDTDGTVEFYVLDTLTPPEGVKLTYIKDLFTSADHWSLVWDEGGLRHYSCARSQASAQARLDRCPRGSEVFVCPPRDHPLYPKGGD